MKMAGTPPLRESTNFLARLSLTLMSLHHLQGIWARILDWRLPIVSLILSSAWLMLKVTMKIGHRSIQLPPGPPTLPLIGNAHLLPRTKLHLKFTEWSKVYGDIYSLKLGPNTAIVLTSPIRVKELLDKRGISTLDRPPSYMGDQITGGMHIALARYGNHWKPLRRMAHDLLSPKACAKYLPIQQAETTQLMYDILTRPENFYFHIRRYATSVIMSIMFGIRCPDFETPFLNEFYHALDMWQNVLDPAAQPPVDLLPILRYIPERWANWKTLCRTVRQLQRRVYFGLLVQCEDRVRKGIRNGCFMEEVFDKSEKVSMNREMSGYLGGALLEGGTETSALFLQTLIQVLVAYPDVQAKGQEEIDRVIGSKRTPTLDDVASLPYLQAIIKETHRFRPVAPLALPHASLTEEKIDNYVIPSGAVIIMNVWGMSHDDKVFDQPELFNPDRFLASEFGTNDNVDQTDRRNDLVFGSGRRKCPGMQFAENSIFLNTMKLLWGFKFSEAVDPSTNLSIKMDLTDLIQGVLIGPKPFLCKIEVRSAAHAQLIESEYHNVKAKLSEYEAESPPVPGS